MSICKSCGEEYHGNTCDVCPLFPKECSGDDFRGMGMCVKCCIEIEDD